MIGAPKIRPGYDLQSGAHGVSVNGSVAQQRCGREYITGRQRRNDRRHSEADDQRGVEEACEESEAQRSENAPGEVRVLAPRGQESDIGAERDDRGYREIDVATAGGHDEHLVDADD